MITVKTVIFYFYFILIYSYSCNARTHFNMLITSDQFNVSLLNENNF